MNIIATARQENSPELVDLLVTTPSLVPFADRVRGLSLSAVLEQKVLHLEGKLPEPRSKLWKGCCQLTEEDEKELATEVLLLRHRFTELVLQARKFRQAALTVVQNIYLFRNRKIFFGSTSSTSSEEERQQALFLFGTNPPKRSLPLAQTFQHLILARVWNRILVSSIETDLQEQQFIDLQAVVEKLNTIRNIYMILTTGLVKKLAARISDIYKESVTHQDAIQIGSFGIARAAYRYHQSTGIRFSTFAANWVFKEIQRQALQGRLIRLSTNAVEQYCRSVRESNAENLGIIPSPIERATIVGENFREEDSSSTAPESAQGPSSLTGHLEATELRATLMQAIDQLLSAKCGDIIKRRYGFPPYKGKEQSVISISQAYGVTRSSIYQLEQAGLKKLHQHLECELGALNCSTELALHQDRPGTGRSDYESVHQGRGRSDRAILRTY